MVISFCQGLQGCKASSRKFECDPSHQNPIYHGHVTRLISETSASRSCCLQLIAYFYGAIMGLIAYYFHRFVLVGLVWEGVGFKFKITRERYGLALCDVSVREHLEMLLTPVNLDMFHFKLPSE